MGIIAYIDSIPLFSTSEEAFTYGIKIGIIKPYKGDIKKNSIHVHRCNIGSNVYRSGYMPGRSHKELMIFLTGSYNEDDDNGYEECKDPDGYKECRCGIKYCKDHYKENPCKKLCDGIDDDDDDGYSEQCKGMGYRTCKCENSGIQFKICIYEKCADYYRKACDDDWSPDDEDDNGIVDWKGGDIGEIGLQTRGASSFPIKGRDKDIFTESAHEESSTDDEY